MKTSQTKTNDKFCNFDFSIVSCLNVSIKMGVLEIMLTLMLCAKFGDWLEVL
jgi:hypothetical protein